MVDDSLLSPCIVNWLIVAGEVIVEVVSRAGVGIPALATTRVEDNLENGPVESAKGGGGDATVESHDSRGT